MTDSNPYDSDKFISDSARKLLALVQADAAAEAKRNVQQRRSPRTSKAVFVPIHRLRNNVGVPVKSHFKPTNRK